MLQDTMPPATSHRLNTLTDDHQSLHLPRILCLHGGGTNARIFKTQCRILRAQLRPYVRLVFAEAPYASKPGPDVVCVYSDWGPFRSWLPPLQSATHTHPQQSTTCPILDSTTFASEKDIRGYTEDIDWCLHEAMERDTLAGATGEFIGVLGFSQGAKMAASLLLRAQNAGQHGNDEDDALLGFRFAVLLAGRGPLLQLEAPSGSGSLPTAGHSRLTTIRRPTVHVHGLLDHGLAHHQEMLGTCCAAGSATLVEWDGAHRVPIKTKDVGVVVAAILDVVRLTDATDSYFSATY